MSAPQHNPGHLYLVVGPSGVGKDSLLDAASAHFADNPGVIFPIRTITRPANSGGESHHAVDAGTFQKMSDDGAFALQWGAHDLQYGIPISIHDELASGHRVVVNVSRTILDDARAHYDHLTIVSITTSPDILAERLRARGRENEDNIQTRLARATAMRPIGPDVIEVDNSGSLEDSRAKFIAALSRHAERDPVQ